MREHNEHTAAVVGLLYVEDRWKDFETWAAGRGIHVNEEFKRAMRAWLEAWALHRRIARNQISTAQVLNLAVGLGPALQYQRLIDEALAHKPTAVETETPGA